jgi:pimeloyl-ACP methyl ester carboxylesterase
MSMVWKVTRIVLALLVLLVMVTWIFAATAKSRLRRQYPPPGQMVSVGSFTLHIDCRGTGNPTVVLDAGLVDFSVHWGKVQPAIARFARVCSYDRAGLGWSEPGPTPRTSSVMIEELHRLLAAAKLAPPYVLVGHSFGGMNARLYAQRYPTEVAGVVLVDASHEDQWARVPRLRAALSEATGQFRTLSRLGTFGVIAFVPEKIPTWGLSDSLGAQYRAVLAGRDHFAGALEELEGFETSLTQVREAHINLGDLPLRVVSRGRADSIPGATAAEQRAYDSTWQVMQVELTALSSRATRVVATRSGHNIPTEQPAIVIDAIRDIVRAIRRPPTAAAEPD